jgi:hypothetical protein
LDNSVNQSAAETQRLLNLKPTTDETPAETQRLMESGTRGTMDTIGAMTAQALGTTQRGLGNFLSNAGKTYAAITGDFDFDNAAIRLGKEIETYAKGNDIYGLDVQKNRMSQAIKLADETDDWIEKNKILGSAISKNKIGFFDIAGSEVVEGLPETALQVAAALMTGGTTLAASGVIATLGVTGSVFETFGSTAEDTYNKAKKAGFSDAEAKDKAYTSAAIGTTIEAAANFVADKALLAPFLNKFTGTLAGTATGFVSSTAIGAVSNLAAGMGQSFTTQYLINPETASLSKAATDGFFEMYIGGAAQGTMGLPVYAIQGGAIIGKDYSGKDLTVADVAAGAILDSSTVNQNATIATTDEGNPVTLGGAMLQMPNYQFDMSTLKTYVPQVFNNDKLIVGKDELGNDVTYGELMGQTTKSMDFDTVYKNLLDITPEQSKAAQTKLISNTFKASGYTPSAAEINALIAAKPTGTTAIKNSVSTYVAPRQVTEAEAKQFFADIGYKPTDAEVKQFVKSGGNVSEAAVKADVAKYVAPLQVTEADARKFFADLGYKPTDAEVKQFVKQAKDADVLKEVSSYVDPRQVTKAEAEKFFADLGYKPTKAEIDSYIKQGGANTQAELAAAASKYVAPRMVTEQEAKAAYTALGLTKPTQADVLKLVGQYDETGLTGRATANLEAARYNSILSQLDSLSVGASKETLDAIALVKKDLNSQITALGGDVSKLQSGVDSIATKQTQTQTQIKNLQKSLSDEIQAAKDIGLKGDAALQAGLNSLSSKMGVNQTELLKQLGTTEAALRTQFSTQISGLDAKLTAAIADAKATGLQGDAALKSAIDKVAADQKVTSASLLTQIGKTEADLKAQFSTQLGAVQTQVGNVQAALTKAIADARAAGLAGDAALQSAIGKVAGDLGTTKTDLLNQVGKTEAVLRTEMESGFAGVNEQYKTLSASQKATADALVAQGKTLQDAITAAKAETTGQIAGVETRLTDAIKAAEAMGLSRDQAITAAVESVAAELGTTKANLLAQMGKTEAALRTEFAAGISGLEAQTKAQYEALTAEQKALANQLQQQGVDMATAIQQAQAQTAGQIGALTADVQAKYNALTAEQKALANQLTQQGVDLNTAIATAQQQTQQQITNLGKDVDARINQLMLQGQTYQQATQQAFAEVNAKNQELSGLIGTQGRAANQSDIDALTQMLGGQRSMDLAYDVTGDKQITQADIDFLTQVVGGKKTDWMAPQQSPWAATGLYGQIQANELQRQKDLADAEARRIADQEAAAEEARKAGIRSNIRTTATQGRQQLQNIQQQLPQALQAAQEVSTPIYGQMGPYLDVGSELDFGFFKPSPEKQAGTKQQQPTKIAAGGYIDDLLAENMTADDLLNLLR